MTTEMMAMEEFDVLLDDVLRSVANPELPERVRVHVRTRVWVREFGALDATSHERPSDTLRPVAGRRVPVVFSLEGFQTRMRAGRSARSTAMALLAHAAAIVLIFWAVATHVQFAAPVRTAALTELTPPPAMAQAKDAMGGGGGQRGTTPVSKGTLPKISEQQITPPKAPPMEQPKIRMPDATIEVQKDLKMANNNMPNLGMPNSALLGSSMGDGRGTGMGAGSGAGLGPGTGGNLGGGLRKIGPGVSAPVLLFSPEPEFSEEARKAKASGNVLVNLIVDASGRPQNVHVLRGVGMGLDEKAIAAVKQYKFRPAMEGGKPVAVELNVEVNFQIF
ncbi:MAG: energy transducer TonB [Acidobacteriaceae bacterium]